MVKFASIPWPIQLACWNHFTRVCVCTKAWILSFIDHPYEQNTSAHSKPFPPIRSFATKNTVALRKHKNVAQLLKYTPIHRMQHHHGLLGNLPHIFVGVVIARLSTREEEARGRKRSDTTPWCFIQVRKRDQERRQSSVHAPNTQMDGKLKG